MYETGKVKTLEELGTQFVSFVQQSDSNTQAWEVVGRNNIDSFYGVTVRVPMKEWTENGKYPYFYVTFVFRQITKLSYSSWVRDPAIEKYMGEMLPIILEDAKYRYVNLGKYGGPNQENPFRDSGQILQVFMHTTFDENLWAAEQGNVNCEYESETQDGKVSINLLQIRRIKYPKDGGDPTEEVINLPVYPGTGCPWFTVSDLNWQEFDLDNMGIDYWFTKSNHNASITIRFRGKVDVYQSLVLGKMNLVHDKSYMFPLYCAGGNQALCEDVYNYVPVYEKSGKKKHLEGNSYYLDIVNPAMSNANPLHPTRFNGSQMSNFRILSPEGRWKNIFAHVQSAHLVQEPSCAADKSKLDYYVLLDPPTHNMSALHSAFPFCGDVRGFVDNYTITQELTQYKSSAILQKILPILNPFTDRVDDLPYESGVAGNLIDCYGYYSRTLEAGVLTFKDNRKFLSIPCGWENRLFWYKPVAGMVSAQEYWLSSSLVRQAIENERIGTIKDKFLVLLGEE